MEKNCFIISCIKSTWYWWLITLGGPTACTGLFLDSRNNVQLKINSLFEGVLKINYLCLTSFLKWFQGNTVISICDVSYNLKLIYSLSFGNYGRPITQLT